MSSGLPDYSKRQVIKLIVNGESYDIHGNTSGDIFTVPQANKAGSLEKLQLDTNNYLKTSLKFKDGSSEYDIALDSSGRLYSISYGVDGVNVRPIKVDENSHLHVLLHGENPGGNDPLHMNADGHLETYIVGDGPTGTPIIASDDDGKLYTLLHGKYGASALPLLCEASGILKNVPYGENDGAYIRQKAEDTGQLRQAIEAFGRNIEYGSIFLENSGSFPVGNWTCTQDADSVSYDPTPYKTAINTICLYIDASDSAYDYATFSYEFDPTIDITKFQSDVLMLWFWVDDIDMFFDGICLTFKLKSGISDYSYWSYTKSQLHEGWQLLILDLNNPSGSYGTLDISAISNFDCQIICPTGNTTDGYFTIDRVYWGTERNATLGNMRKVSLDNYGHVQTVLRGVEDGIIYDAKVDESNRLYVHVDSCDPTVNVRPYRTACEVDQDSNTWTTSGSKSLSAISTRSNLMLGILLLSSDASLASCTIDITIDGWGLTSFTLSEMNTFGINYPHTHACYLTLFDDTNYDYGIAFNPNICIYNYAIFSLGSHPTANTAYKYNFVYVKV